MGNDLKLVLIAPNGSEVTLASYVGMDGDNFIGTTFIMGALQNIEIGTAPFTGEYNPAQSFYTLTGSAQGIWILKVIDEYTGAAGTLDSWSLNIPGENSITNYSWSTGESGSELSQISIIPTGASSVYVTVTDSNGDIASAQFDYTVNQSPVVTVSGTANICENSNAVITASAVTYGYAGSENLELSNSNPLPITDYYSPGVNSQIVVSNSEAMANDLVSVTITSISHTYVEDLALYLTAPDGSWITLAANIGGAGDGYSETEFTASASNFAQFGTAPFTGQFLPADMISTLTGSAQGVWTLKIVDNTPTETGTLLGWTLKLPNYNSIVNYSWSNGANGPNVNEITPSPSNNTSYTVVALDANGCEGTGDFDVSIYPAPTVDITGFDEICLGWDLTLTAYAAADQTIPLVVSESSNVPVVIPDANTDGILSPITIVESSALASELVSVSIDLLNHTWVGDLVIFLVAPDGSMILLQQNVGVAGDNFVNTEYSMSATNPISNGIAPFTGLYIPQQAFSNFTGSAQGTWNLKIIDNAGGDNGTLMAWTLNLPTENIITNYAWSSGETGLEYPAIITYPTSSTAYTVTVTDSRGCDKSDLIDVTVNIPLEVEITQSLGTLYSSAISGNQWYEQSLGMLDGETNQTYTPLADGTYFCGVTDENSCYEVSNSIDFIYSGINGFNQNARVSVYPNPNNGILVSKLTQI
jgi:subtilisin-like proprotein convertase family protein